MVGQNSERVLNCRDIESDEKTLFNSTQNIMANTTKLQRFSFHLLGLLSILFSSCSNVSYYQVYDIQKPDSIVSNEGGLVYEDEHCMVKYDFWQKGGNPGFVIENKTDAILELHLDQSFFVLNGYSNDYFQNRNYTGSVQTGSSRGVVSASNTNQTLRQSVIAGQASTSTAVSKSVSQMEAPNLRIAPHSFKAVIEFAITEDRYNHCDLVRYPAGKSTSQVKFTSSDSPFTFTNFIAYSLQDSDEIIRLEHSFYVSAITNYSEKGMIEVQYVEVCGKKTRYTKRTFRYASPERFYVKYKLSN
jgi:hypothetical protein